MDIQVVNSAEGAAYYVCHYLCKSDLVGWLVGWLFWV